jgi:hypothetical protein
MVQRSRDGTGLVAGKGPWIWRDTSSLCMSEGDKQPHECNNFKLQVPTDNIDKSTNPCYCRQMT